MLLIVFVLFMAGSARPPAEIFRQVRGQSPGDARHERVDEIAAFC